MNIEEERVAYKGFLRYMSGAALQNNKHGRKGKDSSISLGTTCRTEHNTT